RRLAAESRPLTPARGTGRGNAVARERALPLARYHYSRGPRPRFMGPIRPVPPRGVIENSPGAVKPQAPSTYPPGDILPTRWRRDYPGAAMSASPGYAVVTVAARVVRSVPRPPRLLDRVREQQGCDLEAG